MDKITIYKNKGEIFRCQFKVDGADIQETEVRLCLEFEKRNLFFRGSLNKDGECVIEIPQLKEINDKEGKLTVEAIVESVYFKVYESDVELKNSVEVSMAPMKKQAQKTEVKLEGISQEVINKKPIIQEDVTPTKEMWISEKKISLEDSASEQIDELDLKTWQKPNDSVNPYVSDFESYLNKRKKNKVS